jgi:Tol biopolymer transport system component
MDRWPTVTRDARYVVFASTRSGDWNIWRVGLDGSDLRQLTISGAEQGSPTVTMDSRWVVYEAGNTIWKVSIDGGDPAQLVKDGEQPRVSPDGLSFACIYRAPGAARKSLAVFPIEGGNPLHLFELSPVNSFATGFRWSPDGSAILYGADSGYGLLRQSLKGGPPQKVLEQFDQIIFAFDWAAEGPLVFAMGTRARDVVLMQYGR